MTDQSIELKSPKLGYIPIRQFLIIGSILGILYAYSFISAPYPPPYLTIVSYTFAALTFAFNACLFYGALKNDGIALGCCQKFLVFSMVLSFLAFCFMPVLASSLVSSRYDDFSDATNFKIKELLVDIFGLRTMEEYADFDRKHGGYKPTAGQKFLLGVVFSAKNRSSCAALAQQAPVDPDAGQVLYRT
ncbi:unnamed protein product [Caenorhabditis nigoni]